MSKLDKLFRTLLNRDGGCVPKKLDPDHDCHHTRLTIEHVPVRGKNAFGKKALDHERQTMIACWWANSVENWGERHREKQRDYLESIYGTMEVEE